MNFSKAAGLFYGLLAAGVVFLALACRPVEGTKGCASWYQRGEQQCRECPSETQCREKRSVYSRSAIRASKESHEAKK